MKSNQSITIEAKQSASRRTKNRIKENGKEFILIKKDPNSSLFNGQAAILLESISKNSSDGKGGKESWFGWIPMSEVEFLK